MSKKIPDKIRGCTHLNTVVWFALKLRFCTVNKTQKGRNEGKIVEEEAGIGKESGKKRRKEQGKETKIDICRKLKLSVCLSVCPCLVPSVIHFLVCHSRHFPFPCFCFSPFVSCTISVSVSLPVYLFLCVLCYS